jgi:hypothetical protein
MWASRKVAFGAPGLFEVREGLWNETDAGAVPLRGARVPCYD